MLHGVTYLVRDYDEAIAYFTGVLQFDLLEDTPLGGGKRWVRVAPRGGTASATGTQLLLAKASTPEYTIHVEGSKWHEVGEMSRDGKTWMQFFQMDLERKAAN